MMRGFATPAAFFPLFMKHAFPQKGGLCTVKKFVSLVLVLVKNGWKMSGSFSRIELSLGGGG